MELQQLPLNFLKESQAVSKSAVGVNFVSIFTSSQRVKVELERLQPWGEAENVCRQIFRGRQHIFFTRNTR